VRVNKGEQGREEQWEAAWESIPISLVGVDVPEMLGPPFSSLSGVMVDVDVDLEKVLVRGPRWVSFNSAEAT